MAEMSEYDRRMESYKRGWETRRRNRSAMGGRKKGCTLTDEHKQKISASVQRYWDRLREERDSDVAA
jgi:hypothetical protein